MKMKFKITMVSFGKVCRIPRHTDSDTDLLCSLVSPAWESSPNYLKLVGHNIDSEMKVNLYIVVCHLPRAPSYDGVRTWVTGALATINNAEYIL